MKLEGPSIKEKYNVFVYRTERIKVLCHCLFISENVLFKNDYLYSYRIFKTVHNVFLSPTDQNK